MAAIPPLFPGCIVSTRASEVPMQFWPYPDQLPMRTVLFCVD